MFDWKRADAVYELVDIEPLVSYNSDTKTNNPTFQGPPAMSSLSFHEKSLWLMLVSLVAAFGVYFACPPCRAPADVLPHQVALFAVMVGVLVATQVAGHIVIALVDRRTETDERDHLIELEGHAQRRLRAGVGRLLRAVHGARDARQLRVHARPAGLVGGGADASRSSRNWPCIAGGREPWASAADD